MSEGPPGGGVESSVFTVPRGFLITLKNAAWLTSGFGASLQLKSYKLEFSGHPVVRTWRVYCCGPGSVHGWGTKIPQASWCGQKRTYKFVFACHNVVVRCSATKLCPALCNPMDHSTPGSPVLHCLPEMPSNRLIFGCPLLLPSVFPSIRIFSSESALRIRWPKYWSFSISPSNEYSGLITFRIDWLDLLAVQGTLKSLLQHQHNSKNYKMGFPGDSVVKTPCCQFRWHRLNPWLGN